MRGTIAIGAAVVAVAGLGATWFLTRPSMDDALAACRNGAVAGGDIGGPFTLVSETGEEVTSQEVLSTPTILYFGYTYCPDVCPLDTYRNALAAEILAENGMDVQTVFATIDPARDTPDVVARFTDNFADDMLGLTGSEEQVAAAMREWRVYGQKVESGDPETYLMNHSTFSYLVLPDTGFVDYVRRTETPEEVAGRMGCFVEAAGLG